MFENLRQAFREAVENFREELNRDEVPEAVDRILHQMQEEVTEAQAQLRLLEDQLRRARLAAQAETEEAANCRRRESLALRIGDEETARLAREFAGKHERASTIQERKAEALREELEMRRGEVEEMLARIKEARASRDALSATSGRSSARSSLHQTRDLFDELDRMADRIGEAEEGLKAEEDLLAELDGWGEPGYPDAPPPLSPEEEAEARLRELKRRMGRE